MTTSDLDKIKELTGVAPGESEVPHTKTTKVLACEACHHTYPFGGTIPAVCPSCGKSARQWPGENDGDALNKAKTAAGVVATPAAGAATTEAPAAQARTRTRKPKEAQPQPQMAATVPSTPSAGVTPEEREAARDAFKAKFHLNNIDWTKVGAGTVSTVGFTVWKELEGKRVPVYRFFEAFETPESFRALYERFLKESPGTKADALRISDLTPEIDAIVYGHELVATSNMYKGTTRIPPNTPVTIFAKVAASGNIIWAVSPKENN